MIDPTTAGVDEQTWRDSIASCHELVVKRIVPETHDARSIILDIPESLKGTFRYKAGQFLSFKIPFEGHVLVRSYSLASSPDTESEHKVTVKRVEGGRISNLFNDALRVGDALMVVPPAGLFVLRDETRPITLFAGGSGITPVISLIKSALATTRRRCRLVYANRDERSIIFRDELDALALDHPDRLSITHSLDDRDGFLTPERVGVHVDGARDDVFYLCGPSEFMETVEGALRQLGMGRERVHIERFLSPSDHEPLVAAPAAGPEAADVPRRIRVQLDGAAHDVPYEAGEVILGAARRAGLDPPFSCEEGYCSCCMAKLVGGEVDMKINDCLPDDLLEEGWVLTCQARCVRGEVKIEYPD